MWRYIFAALVVGETQQLKVGCCFAMSHDQAKREAEKLVARDYRETVDIYVNVLFDEEYHQHVIAG